MNNDSNVILLNLKPDGIAGHGEVGEEQGGAAVAERLLSPPSLRLLVQSLWEAP
jgi:hypothetical protein